MAILKPNIQNLETLEIAINHNFKDKSLLKLALLHKSAGDGMAGFKSNERLEWLGDRVLGLSAAEFIFGNYPSIEEGGMTKLFNNVVNGYNCAEAARIIGLDKYMVVSKSIENVHSNDSILGDAYEAIIGAIYIDGGKDACKKLIDLAIECAKTGGNGNKNYKSKLQEWAQKRKFNAPNYEIISRTGPDHAPNFLVKVTIGDNEAQANGSSKQAAEQVAAQTLYEKVSQNGR